MRRCLRGAWRGVWPSKCSINKSYNSLQKQKPVLCTGLVDDLQCRVLFLRVSSSPVTCAEVRLGRRGRPPRASVKAWKSDSGKK